jgi:hypothetical protein
MRYIYGSSAADGIMKFPPYTSIIKILALRGVRSRSSWATPLSSLSLSHSVKSNHLGCVFAVHWSKSANSRRHTSELVSAADILNALCFTPCMRAPTHSVCRWGKTACADDYLINNIAFDHFAFLFIWRGRAPFVCRISVRVCGTIWGKQEREGEQLRAF